MNCLIPIAILVAWAICFGGYLYMLANGEID